MNIIEMVKHVLYADHFVTVHKAEEEHRIQRGIAAIAAVSFAVMSVLNVKQQSYPMLATTSLSAIALMVGYWISKYKNNSAILRSIFYIIFLVIFTMYTIAGGNEGFAALWLVTATYAVMIAIDFKAGFVIGLYYLFMLIMVFVGPMTPVLRYDYNKTFMLRFPFFYAINFAFATYILVRIRLYQYKLLMNKEELEQLSATDLSTGLMNRNHFIQYEHSFQCGQLQTLGAVFIDVNGLHEINNRQGHNAGDKMLCIIAGLCKKHFAGHTVFRMGGDEFLILCENEQEQEICAAAQCLYDAVERAGYSVSYGIAFQNADFNLEDIVQKADAKMIEFKTNYYRQADHQYREYHRCQSLDEKQEY